MTLSPRSEDRRPSAAARIGAVDPRVRLSVRRSQLVAAVPLAELLVRVTDLGDSLRPARRRTGGGDPARARTLSEGLDGDFGRILALAQARTPADLDLDLAGELLDARATAQTLASDLYSLNARGSRRLSRAHELTGILDGARARDQHHSSFVASAEGNARDLISVLDNPDGLDRGHATHYLDRLREQLDIILGLAADLDRARASARTLGSASPAIGPVYRWAAIDLGARLSRALDHGLYGLWSPDPDRCPDPVWDQDQPGWDQARALVRGQTRDLDPPLGFVGRRASGRARTRARELASILGGALAGPLGLARPDGLADALLDGALDDFRQADLRGAPLADDALTGVRWSVKGTRWPRGVPVKALIRRSAEIPPGSGSYVITRRTPAPENVPVWYAMR